MRPALRLVRYRHRPMQPVKRSLSQQATARVQPPLTPPDFPPAKRLRDSSPARLRTLPASNTMPFRGRGLSRRPGDRPSSSPHPSRQASKRTSRSAPPKNILNGPFHDQDFILKQYFKSGVDLKHHYKETPKSPLHNFYAVVKNGQLPKYEFTRGSLTKEDKEVEVWRTTVSLDIDPPIFGVGDHADKKESMYLAALSAVYQLHGLNLLENPSRLAPLQPEPLAEVVLSDGDIVTYDRAHSFMDYYCRRFGFKRPEIDFNAKTGNRWEAVMTVGERRIGMGTGKNKKLAQVQCFLDVTQYLESCDPELWKAFVEAARTGKNLGLAPKVLFHASPVIETSIEDLCHDVRRSTLYRNRPSTNVGHSVAVATQQPGSPQAANLSTSHRSRKPFQTTLAIKSKRLLDRRSEYLADPKMEKMRNTRATLPVYTQSKEVMDHISKNEVTICLAATGSGKTTQLPQMILDGYIDRGEGAECNIICTQPRRLAAISVAHRVANERGEQIGRSVGYHVRFEAKHPEPHGSITFCTTGVFLKRLQSFLSDEQSQGEFDNISHIIVDEVHERDVDTDLLLVVLKHLMAQKRAKNQSLKIVLMSATIDPTLFQNYFADERGVPAGAVDIPGRSFPVTKYFMEDFTSTVLSGPMRWVKDQENVARYLVRELGLAPATQLGVRTASGIVETRDDLELPYSFMAAMISHVLQNSEDGHVLVFLPGWDEIMATQRAILTPQGPLGVNFSSSSYSLHLLHSSIPLSEQQAIFEPPAKGVRRIILATNVAETSVTIPDVVYVIDTAKIKEQRYDPDRHMSSLVSSWVGSSNLNQRAGRAGRHRSGEYYGVLGETRAESLQSHQTVEMKRVDLSNVVMHVKALTFPGMTVEEVLAAAIEPPDPRRVDSAMKNLQMVGALDSEKNLTSLGRVLLQLPVDAQVGKMVLYGSFFRCLDQAVTLAAILTNREPFMSPMYVRAEAQRVKNSWSPEDFRSDALATLNAYNTWSSMQSRGEHFAANRFCSENFLSKPTLLLIQKVRNHLLQALYRAGVIDVSAGGEAVIESRRDGVDWNNERRLVVPDALNANRDSLPLLTALISIAAQPKFAIRKDKQSFRTATDKFALIHPSSVNNRKRELAQADQSEDKDKQANAPAEEKQLYTFNEKRRNDTMGLSANTFLVTTTRLDPLVYILFGAHNVEVVQGGLECDDWLPIKGDLRTLDDIWRLKTSMEAAMLRVFEGILMSRQRGKSNLRVLPREADDEAEWEDEDDLKDYSLSRDEVRDLDEMTSALVNLLNRYSDERIATQSVQNSRAGTPAGSPFLNSGRQLPGSGRNTPFYQSRPGTPSRFRRS